MCYVIKLKVIKGNLKLIKSLSLEKGSIKYSLHYKQVDYKNYFQKTSVTNFFFSRNQPTVSLEHFLDLGNPRKTNKVS